MSLRTWAARHVQTLLGALGRLAQQPLATAMTVAVIAVALALPLLLGVFLQNARDATAGWNQALDLSVYLDRKVSAARVQALAKQVRARPDVAAVRVITAEQALTEFKRSSGFGDALEALDGNPLPDTLIVTPATLGGSVAGVDTLRAVLVRQADVQAVQIDSQWVSRLQALLGLARRVVLLAAALLGFGVVLVVGNTIRLDILNRRTEIEVMKLVGATDGFTRRPFLYTGLLYGLGGGVLALVLVGLAVGLLSAPVATLSGLYGSRFRLAFVGWRDCAQVLLIAGGLSWFGSWLAATRHIRTIEPS